MELKIINPADWEGRPLKSRRAGRQERLGPVPNVALRGEALSEPIYWTGKQWAVTAYGLECRDGTYPIEKTRLWENESEHSWYVHMCEKEWLDPADFAQALCEARDFYRDLFPSHKRGKNEAR